MSSNERDDVQIDHPRRARTGIPEVVFGAGKTREQIEYIMRELYREHGFAFATRVSPSAGAQLAGALAQASYDERARTLRCGALARTGLLIGVACAGTSDVAVAEEAALTLDAFGHDVLRRYDVGVAGLHRALAGIEQLDACRAIVVVAGMEGALPSVIAARSWPFPRASATELPSVESPPCLRCSTRARPASRSSTSTMGSAAPPWPTRLQPRTKQ